MGYQEYKKEFLESLRNDSAIRGSDTEDEFFERTLETLSTFNEIEDPYRLGIGDKKGRGGRIMRADGYCFDETDHSLILFISDFQDSYEPGNLTMSRVDELYWRMYYFLDEACNGKMDDYFDDSDDVLKVAHLLRRRINAGLDDPQLIMKIKFYILTNKDLDTKLLDANLLETTIRKTKSKRKTAKTTKKIKKADFNEKPLEINLWYLERFYEMEESNSNEPIIINIPDDYPELEYSGIPCIKCNVGEDLGYHAYIAIIPGDLLAYIYIDHGSKILEGNVRAFLGTNGSKSVNSGIKRTINNDPTRFFTYNNGIATTAADVELEELNGELLITKMVDFQIINGGQTTASLADAVLKKTNIDLVGIFVPMKLTVIEDRELEDDEGIRFYDQMVQSIAKYANSQNKVTAADLFSNDPFHIWMEKMSKRHLAPPSIYPIPTGWYYERSRKKYQQEQIKLRGDFAKRFLLKFPKKQIITKEQLAMYLTTIACKPDIVSRGRDWVMREFGKEIGAIYKADKARFNAFYFKKCVCAAIIFRAVDNYLEINKDSAKKNTGFWYKTGGYKLNIVPYTIAKIISCIPNGYSLDWDEIWQKQSLSPAFQREIEMLTKITNDFICNSHGVIVTEYCKKPSTWENYRDNISYELTSAFFKELLPISMIKEQESFAKSDQKETNDLQIVLNCLSLGADYWQDMLSKGTARSFLSYQDKTILKQVITMAKTGSVPVSNSGKVPYKTMNMIKMILIIKDKLEAEGIMIKHEPKI